MGHRNPIAWPVADLQEPPGPHGLFALPLAEPATRADVAALAAEVRALREALPPQSSLILTGRDVVDAMRQLRARGG